MIQFSAPFSPNLSFSFASSAIESETFSAGPYLKSGSVMVCESELVLRYTSYNAIVLVCSSAAARLYNPRK